MKFFDTTYLLWLIMSVYTFVTGFIETLRHFKETTKKDRELFSRVDEINKEQTNQIQQQIKEQLEITREREQTITETLWKPKL